MGYWPLAASASWDTYKEVGSGRVEATGHTATAAVGKLTQQFEDPGAVGAQRKGKGFRIEISGHIPSRQPMRPQHTSEEGSF